MQSLNAFTDLTSAASPHLETVGWNEFNEFEYNKSYICGILRHPSLLIASKLLTLRCAQTTGYTVFSNLQKYKLLFILLPSAMKSGQLSYQLQEIHNREALVCL